jgi:flagellar biosynthetic protein FlhB
LADPQRTHKATPKRIREFRKRGEIALSRDVVSAATLAGGFVGLLAFAGASRSALIDLTRNAAMASDGGDAVGLPSAAVHGFLVATVPAMAGAALGAVVAMLAQLGWPPAFKLPSFDPSRLSPIKNLPNTLSPVGMLRRSGAAVGKLVLVGTIVVTALRHHVVTAGLEAPGIGALAFGLVRRAMWLVLGALAVIAAIDYFLARRRIGAQMRMTGEEIKREMREQDGDPMVKGRRKQRMRELAKRRMAAAVAKADVVIVNPTHYAVALRYDGTLPAPEVVAKGKDNVALAIRRTAEEAGVTVVHEAPLARALYRDVEIGAQIPEDLFAAVAQVLAFVLRAAGRLRAALA